MRKRIFYFLFFAVIAVSCCYIPGCSSTRAIQNPVIGIIQVVGNEPFTRLAVNINDKDVYLLECTQEVKTELLKNQQKIYQIIYSEVKESEEGITLVVNKAILLKTN
jgi:hypothetical protein